MNGLKRRIDREGLPSLWIRPRGKPLHTRQSRCNIAIYLMHVAYRHRLRKTWLCPTICASSNVPHQRWPDLDVLAAY